MKAHTILLVMLLLVTITSCNSAAPSSGNPLANTATIAHTPTEVSSAQSLPAMATPDFSEITPPPADANPFVKLVEEDLANRLAIALDQIHFLKISDIDWQDIRQGCTATPGQTLTKGRVSGYRIWLEANGKNYLYHIGLDNTIFLCPG